MLRGKDSSVERMIKVLLDLSAFFLAANLSFDLRYYIDWRSVLGDLVRAGPAPWGELYQSMPYLLFGWFVIFAIFGLYQPSASRREELALLIKAQAAAFVFMFATTFFYRGFSYSRGAALFLMPLAFLFTLGFRVLFRMAKEQLLKMRAVRERLVIVGKTEETDTLVQRIARPDNPYQLLGMLLREGQQPGEGVRNLGTPRELGKLLTRSEIDRVLLISGDLSHEELVEAIDTCYRHRVAWAVVPDLYDLLVDRLRLGEVAGIPVMGQSGSKIVGLNLALKRAVDLLVASLLLLVLAPLMLLLALLIKASSRGPVLFVQKRVGRGGRNFNLYKFRSMAHSARDKQHRKLMQRAIVNGEPSDRDANGNLYKLRKDPRVTLLGRWLRRFSIDELPQLLNVIKGDMSLVGPRPAIPYEVKQYRERHRRRLEAPPGITGLWQVSGRNRLSFEEMVELDIRYIENWSMGMDVRIFFKTIAAVLFTRGY